MTPELVALLVLVAGAITRELLAFLERRHRRRGELFTRENDGPTKTR